MAFYEKSVVDAALACSFCGARFGQVAKLVPDCGSVICDDCLRGLLLGGTFMCPVCAISHKVPDTGFQDCRRTMRLLLAAPLEKQLGDTDRQILSLLDNIQQDLQVISDCNLKQHYDRYFECFQGRVRQETARAIESILECERGFLETIQDHHRAGKCLDCLNYPCSRGLHTLDKTQAKRDEFVAAEATNLSKWRKRLLGIETVQDDEKQDILKKATILADRVKRSNTGQDSDQGLPKCSLAYEYVPEHTTGAGLRPSYTGVCKCGHHLIGYGLESLKPGEL